MFENIVEVTLKLNGQAVDMEETRGKKVADADNRRTKYMRRGR